MKNSKFRILMYANVLFIILAVVGNIYGYYLTNSYQFLLNIGAIIFSLVYLLYGYKKNAADYFKFFMLFLALKELLAIESMLVEEGAPIYAVVIVATMMLGFVVLAFGKDLGKKKSTIACAIVVGLSVLTLIVGMMYTPKDLTKNVLVGITLNIFNLTRVLMTSITAIMVYAKYEDKYARGTK